ncbi:hypothetical protein Q666_02525 [Marinobacter sp. ES-1]|jgi:hypothetical protein|uniref:TadE/TadG family type IV pilus assembly protein n=1 Tax=Marinobacter sp. ES-1 TaxID=1396858 RepID=UPI0003B8586E|nr:TadE family protein [Marinobacter sp. ES-1]ERP90168.1 hypothetical protein Q666_02525 [Marinobacter sp. ES-1]
MFGIGCVFNSRQSGVVALEFILVFPLLVGLLYAGLVYGMLFFSKVELQRAADAAVTSVYYLDRRDLEPEHYQDFGQKVRAHADEALRRAVVPLVGRLSVNDAACDTQEVGGDPVKVVMLECSLTAAPMKDKASFLPQLNLSFLGNFPPQPATLSAKAAVTF